MSAMVYASMKIKRLKKFILCMSQTVYDSKHIHHFIYPYKMYVVTNMLSLCW